MSSDNLQLNQNYVQNGLGTLTLVIPTTGNYNARVQCTVPSAIATDGGAGSGRDLGLGARGGLPGASQALQTSSNGQTGLGQAFPQVPANASNGNPTTMPESTPNLPSVAPGNGSAGQGFLGTVTDGAAAAVGQTAVSSSLVITITDTTSSTVIYTSTVPTPTQGQVDFKVSFQATAADSITVVFSSSNANDKTLQAIRANVSIGQGL